MSFTKIRLTFLLAILITYGQTLKEDCDSNACLQEEQTDFLPVLPPIKVGEKTFYIENFFKANWYRAIQFCRYNAMQLASINNQEENDILVGELLKAYGDRAPKVNGTADGISLLRFWTSGNDLAVNGTYFWISTGADFKYQNWEPKQPDHTIHETEEEHCVELRIWNSTTLMWNDAACSSESFVICEF